ncbi:uncharacterized protein [Triticum aestivum]|uniref:uncharacterized protein n=1 Tax=Triticum aestivum TaxID=4565 RepID=UPI001D029437|nr:uncharacterized protein LOC123066717 [Triticum aestivum]
MEFLTQPFGRSSVIEEVGESLVPSPVARAPTGCGMLEEPSMAVRSTVLEELGDCLMPDAVLPCLRGDGTVEEQQVAERPGAVDSTDAQVFAANEALVCRRDNSPPASELSTMKMNLLVGTRG